MMNKHWRRLTGWLLALVMILTVVPAATFAETDDENKQEVIGNTLDAPPLGQRSEEADITAATTITYSADVAAMDPNTENSIHLVVSGLDEDKTIGDETKLVVSLPDTIRATEKGLQEFSNDAVSAELNDNQLIFSWKNGKQSAFEATIAVQPHLPADKDLSGSYVLGTARKSMLGTRTTKDKDRDKLYASVFTESGSKIRPATDENPVWVLEHVSGDYYTVRAQNTNKYIYISPAKKGQYLASSLYLVEGNSETAQKILVKNVGDGYYSFTFKHTDGKEYAINNSGNDKEGNSAVRGFGCWTYAGLPNEKFKLYSPSAFDNSATVDLSGTWVITNTTGKVSLTSEASQAKHLNGMAYSLKDGVTLTEDAVVTFTFEHVIRDWYTVKTDAGYLNITADGAYISSTPQRLMAKTEDDFATIMLTTGEYLDSNANVCPTYALSCTNKVFGGGISKNTANTRMQLVSSSEFANVDTMGFLYFDINGGTGAEVPQTITGEAGEKVVLPEMSATRSGQEFIGWADVKDFYSKVPGTNHTYHDIYKAGTSYTMKSGTTKLYAVYNATTRKVQFGIRKDGIIQDEPNGYPVNAYCGHFTVEGILKEGHWVIDIDPTKPVNDYYVQNNVIAALNWVPTAEEIAAALKKEGNIDFDPETQYIHYYVLKDTSATVWKVDGVIRNKANVEITYDANVPGTEKAQITNMPGGYQVAPGTDILIGADQDSTEIKRPGRKGYYFRGWNTEKDGSGTYYNESRTIHMTKNLYLYAQWVSEEDELLEIRITSDWPAGKTGHVGDKITLTAVLSGFENKEYTLKWQYSTDLENWTDVPNAHEITYTYTLNETTTHYTWRAIAEDIR